MITGPRRRVYTTESQMRPMPDPTGRIRRSDRAATSNEGTAIMTRENKAQATFMVGGILAAAAMFALPNWARHHEAQSFVHAAAGIEEPIVIESHDYQYLLTEVLEIDDAEHRKQAVALLREAPPAGDDGVEIDAERYTSILEKAEASHTRINLGNGMLRANHHVREDLLQQMGDGSVAISAASYERVMGFVLDQDNNSCRTALSAILHGEEGDENYRLGTPPDAVSETSAGHAA